MQKNIFMYLSILLLSLLSSYASAINKDSLPITTTIKGKQSICYPVNKQSSLRKIKSTKKYEAKGVASWYGKQFHKKRTSSGERYNMYQLTAAHKSLPLLSHVVVTNLKNGRRVVVQVNDRGPFIKNRLIDLSYAAAKKLNMVGRGLAPVSVKRVVCV